MKLFIERKNKEVEFKLVKPKKLIEILREFEIHVESVILVKNNEVCLEDEWISDEDELKILSVVSGG